MPGLPSGSGGDVVSQEVLYRKWRPQRFGDVHGQDPVITTLRNAVAAGQPAHAYLLSGPRGTGKTTTGRILAKAVNCTAPTEDGEPCEACPSCVSFNEGRALDLIELDAASNRGIDEIRNLREAAGYAPNAARYKVYLIDEVHMLTEAAFNALLKTLEEPPPHVVFILATTEPYKIPATILSRCQRFDFRRIPVNEIVRRLRTVADGEGFQIDDAALELIARQSTGALRDAENLLDQLVAYHGRALDLESVRSGLGLVVDDRANDLARASMARDLGLGLRILGAVRDDGVEMRAFIASVVESLRAALMVKAGGGETLGLSDTEMEHLRALAGDAGVDDIVAALRAFGEIDFRGDAYDALPAEIAFATLVSRVDKPVAASAPVAATTSPAPAPTTSAPRPPAQRQPSTARRTTTSGDASRQAARQAPSAAPPAEPEAVAGRLDEPRRQAPAFVPPDDGDVSPELAALRERWGTIYEAARKGHVRAGALLNSTCFIKQFAGDTVELGFRSPVHVEQVKTFEGVLSAIQAAFTQVVGRPVEVVPVVWEALGRGAPPAPSRSAGGHLVDEAVRLGAQVVEE